MAQRGGRVLLVDADLRRPSIHTVLGLNSEEGLSTVISGSTTFEAAVQSTPVDNLFVLTAGPLPPSPADLLGSDAMKTLLQRCATEYSFVIVDAPPVLSVTDAVILSVEVDGVVLVVRAGATTKHCVRRTRDLVAGVNARILGVVVNAMKLNAADSYYYYGESKYSQYYNYYSDPERTAKSATGKGAGTA